MRKHRILDMFLPKQSDEGKYGSYMQLIQWVEAPKHGTKHFTERGSNKMYLELQVPPTRREK